MRLMVLLAALLCMQGAVSQQVDHVSEMERLALVRIVSSLDDIEGLIRTARSAQDPETRFPVHYEALSIDVQTMKAALLEHLQRPSRSPKSVRPLKFQSTSLIDVDVDVGRAQVEDERSD